MPSTYSTNLKIELIPTGAQSGVWGVTTNSNLGTAMEQAIVGTATCVTADFTANVATYTLIDSNVAQTARAFCLNITATLTAAGTINVPALQKPYLIFNNSVGGFAVTVKVSGQTGVSVPNGSKAWLYNNGTDVGVAFNYAPSLTLGTPLLPASGGTGITSLGTGVATWLQTPSSANLQAAVTDETGSGTLVFSNSPTLVTPNLGVPSFATLTNATGLPLTTGVTGTLLTDKGGTGQTAYTAGDLTYYASGTAFTKLAIGASTFVLTSSGTAPQWTAPSSVVIGTATNLAGGATGSVPYQSTASTTTFLSLGTSGQVLTAGASAPQYVAQSTLSVGTSINIASGSANQIPFQTGAGATSFIVAPTTIGFVLGWNGTSFVWVNAPSATSATNLAGGSAGVVPYQTGSGATSFTTVGTAGQSLISNGTSAPAFATLSVIGGGTGETTYTDGQLLIGNSTGNTLTKTTLTAGTGVTITNGSGAITIAATGTGGTVTSVSQTFTGGIVSVAGSPITGAGTLALTVAGTSGGVPYFSSGTTWATSATLDQYGIVYGGGAGAAPATTAVGTVGQILTSNGAGVAPTFQTPSGGGAQGFVTQYQGPSVAPTMNSFSIALI